MLNILLFNGGISKHNTNTVVLKFKEICESRGHNVNLIDGYFQDCKACGACIKTRKCCINDDITINLGKEYDAIIIGSPIYFFNISSKAKSFLDRLYSICLDSKILTFLLIGGSQKYSVNSGFDIIDSSLHRISQYCGTIYVDPFFKCTEDKFSGNLSIEDIEGLTDLILDMEEVNNEIKEENYCGN